MACAVGVRAVAACPRYVKMFIAVQHKKWASSLSVFLRNTIYKSKKGSEFVRWRPGVMLWTPVHNDATFILIRLFDSFSINEQLLSLQFRDWSDPKTSNHFYVRWMAKVQLQRIIKVAFWIFMRVALWMCCAGGWDVLCLAHFCGGGRSLMPFCCNYGDVVKQMESTSRKNKI